MSFPVRFALAAGLGSFLVYKGARVAFAQSKSPLDPEKPTSFPLLSVYPETHNTRRYRFALQPGQNLGLTVSSCVVVSAPIGENGKSVQRPYTPVSDVNDSGFFDLMVKEYPNGKMSKHIANLKPGQTLDVQGPYESVVIKPNFKKKIGMIAGGTGITPMYQVLRKLLDDPSDKTEITLIFANQSEDDIILKEELDRLELLHPRFKVVYVVDKSNNPNFKGQVGYFNKDLGKKFLPSPSKDNLVLVCGPPPMMKVISGDKGPNYTQGELTGILKDLGYTSDQVYKF
eukprot:TRINITY_DN14899_c0_g1_i1.p1 TRINITY_DN14899_c0_g1~~TRINITY_DN14899_c0_g1_i1.p1  ORF type:complete len:286 (-),score=60.00 TRINITY_DN14899_c0_g1_i1:31-888(-)